MTLVTLCKTLSLW